MKERLSRNNLETVFGVSEIPTDTQIQTILDQTEPKHLSPLAASLTLGEQRQPERALGGDLPGASLEVSQPPAGAAGGNGHQDIP